MRRALLGGLAVALAATWSAAPAHAVPRAKWDLSSHIGFTAAVAVGGGKSVVIEAWRSAPLEPQMCVHVSRPINGNPDGFSYCQPVRYVISPHPPWRAHAAAILRTAEGDIAVDGWWEGKGSARPTVFFGATYSLWSPVVVGMTLSKRAVVRGSIVFEGRHYELRGHPGFMRMHAPM